VQCSAAAVEDMLRHMGMGGEQDDARDGVLCFRDWGLVHPELRAEVMAGQHRIEALRQYGTERGCGASELWWTCHLYDEGMENGQGTRWGGSETSTTNKTWTDTLPKELNLQLRVNRRGSSLPDRPGDMWIQLVLAAEQDDGLFRGTKSEVQKRIREVLRLGHADTFPAGRVVTLWRNQRWRTMITRWYRTEVGRGACTSISTWEWMASLRIDSVSEERRRSAPDDMEG
ncbi:MAG: hypothetical protein ACRERD_15295, partial [Candidatus Binatia bacterium]